MKKAYLISGCRFGFHSFLVGYNDGEWVKYNKYHDILFYREISIPDYARESIGTFTWKI